MSKLVGRIVRLRLAPRECMSIVDVLHRMGEAPERLSFDQACRIALTGLLATFRIQGLIPSHDGFDYAELMKPFEGRPRHEITLAKEEAKRLNLDMTKEKEDPIPALIERAIEVQRAIKERCLLDPYNHPDETDLQDYSRTVTTIYEAQGIDCEMTAEELLHFAATQLPKRRT